MSSRESSSPSRAGVVRVTGLNVHPIKSCRAVPMDQVTVDPLGIAGDRRFMLVDGRGRFVSQRRCPKLATVTAKLEEEEVEEDGRRRISRSLLTASAPGMDRDLRVVPRLEGPRTEVSVWESRVGAVDQGEEAAQWFSELLGVGSTYNRLVACAEASGGFDRRVDNLPASLSKKLPKMPIGFADVGPISLLSEESLADLNRRLGERLGSGGRVAAGSGVPINRFRMNVIVSGCLRPYEEDGWLTIKIGTTPFLVYADAEVCTWP